MHDEALIYFNIRCENISSYAKYTKLIRKLEAFSSDKNARK